MTPPTRLILVGGFLGAGKTTLIARVAEMLSARGLRVGLITNDQSTDLVDTASLRQGGFDVEEVVGGCFCCRFDDLAAAAERLLSEHRPDILIGEPVGSCTDISATVLQPIKDQLKDRFVLSPFTVLVDPVRMVDFLNWEEQPFPDDVMYIYGKQLEEADRILVGKCDLLAESGVSAMLEMVRERFPDVPVEAVSGRSGRGLSEWLDAMLTETASGRRVADVDYQRYAQGEARLGWLNATVHLHSTEARDWKDVVGSLIARLARELATQGAEIAHLKLLAQTETGAVRANVTRTGETPSLEGDVAASTSATLLINARVNLDPAGLRNSVERALQGLSAVRVEIVNLSSFSPAPPQPKHRYSKPI